MGREFAKREKSCRERRFWLVDGAYAPERVEGEPSQFVKPECLELLWPKAAHRERHNQLRQSAQRPSDLTTRLDHAH